MSIVAAVATTVALGAVGHATRAEPAWSGLDQELVAAYASTKGISRAAAVGGIAQEELINDVLGQLAEEYGESTYDVWLDDKSGDLVLHARTVDPLVLAVLSEIAVSAEVPLAVDADTAVVASRTEVASNFAEELGAVTPELAGFYVDPVDGALVLDIASTDTALVSGSVSLAASITGLGTRANMVGPAGDHATVNGGSTMVGCTMGFTATYNNGSTTYQGFLTAAHCGTSERYYYNTAGTGTLKSAIYRTRTWNAYGDIAFHSVASSDWPAASYFGSSALSPTIQGGVTTAAAGTTVCRRGKEIGLDCGKVSSTSYTPTWSGACNGYTCKPVFVRTPQKGIDGDSGGPVWSGTSRPVGIHKGGSEGVLGIGQYSVYSKLSYRPGGVTLK
jgi:hypothetical protein